jgi:uncharacterized protein YciI
VFVLLVTYRAPLERIDELRPRHMAYLQRHYGDGTFLVSGRQRPPAGGVIVAADVDRAELERIIATDPYVTEDAAVVHDRRVRADDGRRLDPGRLHRRRRCRPPHVGPSRPP